MVTVYISYPGDKDTRFDRKYYREDHLPLVMDCWASYGLESLAAFYPENDGSGVVALCVCTFRDEAAVDASFHSDRASEVMEDIIHFTDARPDQLRTVPLSA